MAGQRGEGGAWKTSHQGGLACSDGRSPEEMQLHMQGAAGIRSLLSLKPALLKE